MVLLVLSAVARPTAELTGRVVDVADGDTITIVTVDDRHVEVRLAEIDAPEHGQPYADASRRRLRELVLEAGVRLEVQDIDKLGRTVARVFVGRLDVSAEMVRTGAAWAYRLYLRDDALLDLEAEARDARRGLWDLPEDQRVAPWDWRHARPHVQSTTAGASTRCDIKGNVSSSGERVYHVPGQRYYDVTQISITKGERWFCSENEARAAGWRKSRR